VPPLTERGVARLLMVMRVQHPLSVAWLLTKHCLGGSAQVMLIFDQSLNEHSCQNNGGPPLAGKHAATGILLLAIQLLTCDVTATVMPHNSITSLAHP